MVNENVDESPPVATAEGGDTPLLTPGQQAAALGESTQEGDAQLITESTVEVPAPPAAETPSETSSETPAVTQEAPSPEPTAPLTGQEGYNRQMQARESQMQQRESQAYQRDLQQAIGQWKTQEVEKFEAQGLPVELAQATAQWGADQWNMANQIQTSAQQQVQEIEAKYRTAIHFAKESNYAVDPMSLIEHDSPEAMRDAVQKHSSVGSENAALKKELAETNTRLAKLEKGRVPAQRFESIQTSPGGTDDDSFMTRYGDQSYTPTAADDARANGIMRKNGTLQYQ